MTPGVLHVLVPRGVHDPLRVSGGNSYDRQLCSALSRLGWQVQVVQVEGGWPWRPAVGRRDLERALRDLADGTLVLVDGLLASRLPEVMVPASSRLRVVLLVHLPAGVDDELARLPERRVAAAAASVVAPSAWCRDWLVRHYDLDPARVHVAHPGVETAPAAPGSGSGTSLLSVGSVTEVKGQDHLVEALSDLCDLSWHWTCVGSTSVDPHFAERLVGTAAALGVAERCVFAGPLAGHDLEAAYADADLLVLPSRAETYGMVVTEALSRGTPVLAADVGGVGEALGETAAGLRPGLLVGPGDVAGLAAALRRWLSDAGLRADLRAAALERRSGLAGWSVTAQLVGSVVREAAA